MASRTVDVLNKRGLHARASAKFVTLASSQPAEEIGRASCRERV